MSHNPTKIFLTAADRSQELGLPENSSWDDIRRHTHSKRAEEVRSNAEKIGLNVQAPKDIHALYELNCKIAKRGQKLRR